MQDLPRCVQGASDQANRLFRSQGFLHLPKQGQCFRGCFRYVYGALIFQGFPYLFRQLGGGMIQMCRLGLGDDNAEWVPMQKLAIG